MITTIATAKNLYQAALLNEYKLIRPAPGQWLVEVGRFGLICDTRTKTPRIFKTLDAAVSALEQIGFTIDCLTFCQD